MREDERVHLDTGLGRHLLEAHSLDFVANADPALVLTQIGRRALGCVEQQGVPICAIWPGLQGRQQIVEARRPGRGLLSKAVGDAILSDAEEPGTYPLDRLHQPVGDHQLGKDILQDVFHFVRVGQPPPEKGSEPALLLPDGFRDLLILLLFDGGRAFDLIVATNEAREYWDGCELDLYRLPQVSGGRRAPFDEFERQAMEILQEHGGKLLHALHPIAALPDAELPDEVHVLSFPSEAAFDAYRADPALVALGDLRREAIEATQLLIGKALA